ncbi:MAG: hypothetical protein OXQ90_00620, partial [Gammaproteobacteria bacterium]|nr:hypothetical protein [Gammaproteobacteria bacterium]
GLPAFPPGVDYLTTLAAVSPAAVGCGTLKPVIKDARRVANSTRQSPGSLCTFRRCTAGLAQDRRGRHDRRFP